jgi:hypothetical protein
MIKEIEIQVNNVTPSQFFAYIRKMCKKKGIDFDIELDEFKNPTQRWNSRYYVIEDKMICYSDNYRYEQDASKAPCKSEVAKLLPYDQQTYILGFDGSCFNEICEFTFDDEKKGHGYYYQINRDAE